MTIETIISPIIGIDLGTTIGMTIEEINTGLMKGETIIDKTNKRDNFRNRQNYGRNNTQQRYRNRSESRENSRHYKMTI